VDARGESFFPALWRAEHFSSGRFVGPIRPVIPMIAGMWICPPGVSLLGSKISLGRWPEAPVYVIPGYGGGHAASWAVTRVFLAKERPLACWRPIVQRSGALVFLLQNGKTKESAGKRVWPLNERLPCLG